MSELSGIAKIKRTLEFAKQHELGCDLRYFDVIELLGHIESLEESIRLQDAEQPDVSVAQNKCVWQQIANEPDQSVWSTGCGYIYYSADPKPEYCPHCGEEIEEVVR